MAKIEFRKNYDYSKRSKIVFKDPSLTVQDAKDECDVNKILERFARTGLIDHVTHVKGSYGDFTDLPDYQDSLNRVIAAQDSFMRLPAKVRERFDNDALKFLEFTSDANNVDEMVRLGLAKLRDPEQDPSGKKKSAPKAPPGGDPKDGAESKT